MNQKYIVENLEFDPKFKNAKEIEDLKFKRDQAIGIWDIEGKTDDEIKDLEFKSLNGLGVWDARGRNEDERINDLWEKVQDYMGVYLTSLEYCNNRPHPLTAFK